MFLEDETLTDNLTDDISIRLLKMGEAIWCLYPDCVTSFVKVIRLVNELGGADSEAMKEELLVKIFNLSGVFVSNLDLSLEALIEIVTQKLEENYAPKQ